MVNVYKLVIKKGKIIIGELWLLNEVRARKTLIEYNNNTHTHNIYINIYTYLHFYMFIFSHIVTVLLYYWCDGALA